MTYFVAVSGTVETIDVGDGKITFSGAAINLTMFGYK
jgi:hypothetical protein